MSGQLHLAVRDAENTSVIQQRKGLRVMRALVLAQGQRTKNTGKSRRMMNRQDLQVATFLVELH